MKKKPFTWQHLANIWHSLGVKPEEVQQILEREILDKNWIGTETKIGRMWNDTDIRIFFLMFLDEVAAYQKKNEYDYPMLNTKNYVIKNSIVTSIKDPTSNLNIKDDILIVNSEKILPIMYEKKIFLIN